MSNNHLELYIKYVEAPLFNKYLPPPVVIKFKEIYLVERKSFIKFIRINGTIDFVFVEGVHLFCVSLSNFLVNVFNN